MNGETAMNELTLSTAAFLEGGLSYALNLVTAILIIVAGSICAGWVYRGIRARLSSVEGFDATLIPIIAQVGRYFIYILTLVLVLAEFGVQTTSIIAVLGAAGLAIGLALQGTLQNVASGLMLLLLRPYRIGDYVEAGGTAGTVDEIGLFMTRMHTPQNLFVAVPNSKVFGDTIVNYSMRAQRRLDLLVGISYDDDIDKAVKVLESLVGADERFLKKPAPLVIVKALGDSSVDLEIRAWVRRAQYMEVYWDTVRAVKYALDDAGISIPYPHRQIVVSKPLEEIAS
ncbi:MAG: mechanosensitive ion channel domain-containing protein [Hyphomicrobiaceae bacterium]